MKSAISRIPCLVMLCIICLLFTNTGLATNNKTIAYTNCKANLREKTSINSNRVAVLSKGTEVLIIENVESDGETWYYITVDKQKVQGYILASLLDISEEQIGNSNENSNTTSITLNDVTLYADFLNACKQIGMDTSKIRDFKQMDDWVSGPRFSFTYLNMGFRLYGNMDSTVNTIELGVDTDIYKQGYESYQVSDYIVDVSMATELQALSEEYVRKQLNYPSMADFSLFDWSFGRERNLYSISSQVTAINAFGVKDEISFNLVYYIDNRNKNLVYFMLDGDEIVNDLSSVVTADRQRITSSNSTSKSDDGIIILIYGQLGEYGKTVTLDGDDYINYHVPKGSYTITNKGKWCKVYLAKDKYHKNSDGYMENDILKTLELTYFGETQTITVSFGQHIELTIGASITLTPN